jgi:hypothetical protein
MKLIIKKIGLYGVPTEATMTHGNSDELVWNIALFDKMSVTDNIDIFEQINSYWERQPISVQDRIFDIYKRIKDVFGEIWDSNELTRRLYSLVAELYEYHKLDDIRHWVDFYSNLLLPQGLREVYADSHEMPGTRERTYLKEDYKWLVTLSIALRVMIPIWGEFIARTKKETGTALKEYYAFQLLSNSNIFKSEPMERLRIYVEHSLPTDKPLSSAILGGISSEDFPIWILSLVAIRRLSVGDIRGIDPNYSLVTFIYKYIGQKVKGNDNNFTGIIKDKITEDQGQDSENNLSKLEGYKIKQDLPAGDIAIINHYLQNISNLATLICPDINVDLINSSLESARVLETRQLWKPQVILAQWVMKPLVSPKGILHVNKTTMINILAVTQALLIHREHYVLAGLVTAIEQDNNDELLLGGTDSRARITKEQLEQLDRLFPYSRKPTGKQKVVKRINPAVEAIESVASMFSEYDWRLTLHDTYVEKITGNAHNRGYSIPYNIKILLANLAISLANRTF